MEITVITNVQCHCYFTAENQINQEGEVTSRNNLTSNKKEKIQRFERQSGLWGTIT